MPPAPGRTPRPVVAKLLLYKDRDLLLQRARETGPFEVENRRVKESWLCLETYRTGRDDQNSHKPPTTRSRRKRRHSAFRPRRDRVLWPRKTQASQGKRVAIRAAASLTVLPTSDEEKTSHTDAGKMEDSSDHESVADPFGDLPHVTPQTPHYCTELRMRE
ncbi:hypothetical protein NDU88_009947 [Pleurodeles waltl]|uniref:Uncharacterized protein n=1 Tax=Pleurodeles waltl TaxID=8319 RepID=A0AAV7RZR4_PLEWA|nr:hypothetical protein NDU88_009947 [Pleurodeles waltl]